jgi:2,3-bisphosphoglycerate-dependent phosphoglycerate mutase
MRDISKPQMKLYLLRHAERGHGEDQDKLTELGVEQSKRLVPYLKTLNIKKVICASTNRAKETIKPFIQDSNLEVEYTSLVNEQEMGELTGRSGAEYKEALKESGLSKDEFRPAGGENYSDLMNRAKKFLELLRNEKTENILISTHAGFIRSVIILLLNLPREELTFDSASITSLEINKNFKVVNYKLNKG